MNAYFVLGIITVIWAVGLTAVGLTRDDFPSSGAALRAVVGVSVLLVASTLVALMATTHREHPRQEAAAEAAEAAEEQGAEGSKAGAGGKISVDEDEFSIDIDGGNTLDGPGEYTFEVDNSGRIDHDFAVEGDGVDDKTDLIDPGGKGTLTVDLEAGDYRAYCTVPGHAEQGMELDLTVE